ncbi:hypothetical protein ACPB9E_30645 [Streptomyces exfoliatus]|uniref:hypothetical protein n=1 Tax=Streptomyces exfoliatus TaxID=1905 RepID=UPI003C2C767A
MDAGGVALVGAIAAVLGAAVGAGGAIGAAAVSGRRQAAAQHDHWRRQLRRDAYANLLSQALAKRSQISAVETALLRGDREQASSALIPAVKLDALHEALTIVSLEGPETAFQAALELVTAFSGQVGLLLVAEQSDAVSGAGDPLFLELQQRRHEAHEAVQAFQAFARRLLE